MDPFGCSETDRGAIARLKQWYSGDLHDSLEYLGLGGHPPGISLYAAPEPGAVICGPRVTAQFGPAQRRAPAWGS